MNILIQCYVYHLSINRNIVECKGICCFVFDILLYVLIETLWNVKDAASGEVARLPGSINRNIVECKGV